MTIAVLGAGGVGGLLAGVLDRAGRDVVVIAREDTAAVIGERGLRVRSVQFGDFTARVRVNSRLAEPVQAVVVATKATGLSSGLERVEASPPLVVPLLNGLEHLSVLRERFGSGAVVAGTIRVESDRPEPGVIVHTSPFVYVEVASDDPAARPRIDALVAAFQESGVPAGVGLSEAHVMWSKLVRLAPLALVTSAHDKLLGGIRATPELSDELRHAVAESCVVAGAEGADMDPAEALAELQRAHETLGSSMQRDIAAGRPPELDAIAGAVLRSAARHGIACPTIERLAAMVAARAGIPVPRCDAEGDGSAGA